MPLETATYISDLNSANPAHTDPNSQADSHARLIKATLQTTFPNVNAAVTATPAQLNSALTPTTLLTAVGACPPGAIMDFGMATAPTGWLPCDGQSLAITGTYAALFAAIGYTWGGSGANFNLPPFQALGYFRRHRDASTRSGAVGNLQGCVNVSHTHVVPSGTSGVASADHTHTQQGTLGTSTINGSTYPNAVSHSHTYGQVTIGSQAGNASGYFGLSLNTFTSTATNAVNTDHAHAFTLSGQTSGRSADHTHATPSSTTGTGSADGAVEGHPSCATVLTCIKY